MKISVCIPMYNENAVCTRAADTLLVAAQSMAPQHDCTIVFFDDGSTDGTGEKLRKYIEKLGTDRLLVFGSPKNRGKGGAVRDAVLAAPESDCIIYTDCDLAYGTDVILQAAEMIAKGNKMVVGSRNLRKDGYGRYSPVRRFASKMYIKIIAAFAGFRLSDSQCGFKAFEGALAKKIFPLCTVNGFSFDLEVIKIAQRMGVDIVEMPVKIVNHRESKIHLIRDSVHMLSDIRKIKERVKKLDIE